jgi:hypothetical protein
MPPVAAVPEVVDQATAEPAPIPPTVVAVCGHEFSCRPTKVWRCDGRCQQQRVLGCRHLEERRTPRTRYGRADGRGTREASFRWWRIATAAVLGMTAYVVWVLIMNGVSQKILILNWPASPPINQPRPRRPPHPRRTNEQHHLDTGKVARTCWRACLSRDIFNPAACACASHRWPPHRDRAQCEPAAQRHAGQCSGGMGGLRTE